jgi:glycosyltransferase involved in cell wall biosynthesis
MNVGGPAVLLSELISGLSTEEFEHILITGRCESNEIDLLDQFPLKSRVIYIDEIRRSILPLKDLKSFIKLIFILRKINPRIVHTHTSKAGVLGRLASIIACRKARIIHTYHGHLLYGYFTERKKRAVVLIETYLSSKSQVLIAVANQVKRDLMFAGIGVNSDWRLIHPGVSEAFISTKNVRKDQVFTIGWIGRFTDIKNPMLAIRSFELLQMDYLGDVKLLMAGEGELWEDCQKYSSDRNLNIEFLGWVTPISIMLNRIDVLLMSSGNEGMPVVIVEAALNSVPTVSTDVGGVSDFIQDGVTGMLTTLESSSICQTLEQLKTDSKLRTSLGIQARELANTRFSISNYINSHINLYREIS